MQNESDDPLKLILSPDLPVEEMIERVLAQREAVRRRIGIHPEKGEASWVH